jgi:hypothetical protein
MAARKGVCGTQQSYSRHVSSGTLNKQRHHSKHSLNKPRHHTDILITAYQGDAAFKELLQQKKQHKSSTDQGCNTSEINSILGLRPQAQEDSTLQVE